MAKNSYIVDTNVILHDPSAIFNFGGAELLLPMSVIEDLDRFKSKTGELAHNARVVLSTLDGLRAKGKLIDGIRLDSGGILRIEQDTLENNSEHLKALTAVGADRVKTIRLAWQRKLNGKSCALITKDLATRLKADMLGIVVEDYLKQQVDSEHLFKGYRKVVVPNDLLIELEVLAASQGPLSRHRRLSQELEKVVLEEDGNEAVGSDDTEKDTKPAGDDKKSYAAAALDGHRKWATRAAVRARLQAVMDEADLPELMPNEFVAIYDDPSSVEAKMLLCLKRTSSLKHHHHHHHHRDRAGTDDLIADGQVRHSQPDSTSAEVADSSSPGKGRDATTGLNQSSTSATDSNADGDDDSNSGGEDKTEEVYGRDRSIEDHSSGFELRGVRQSSRIWNIFARSDQQRMAIAMLLDPAISIVTLTGAAGTGKTLLALAAALSQTFCPKPRYQQILVTRPIVSLGKDLGALPGAKDEKMLPWMAPIYDNLEYLVGKKGTGPSGDSSKHAGRSNNRYAMLDEDTDDDDNEVSAAYAAMGYSIGPAGKIPNTLSKRQRKRAMRRLSDAKQRQHQQQQHHQKKDARGHQSPSHHHHDNDSPQRDTGTHDHSSSESPRSASSPREQHQQAAAHHSSDANFEDRYSPEEEEIMENTTYDVAMEKIGLEAVAYIRGRSINNTFFVVDESQNTTPLQLKTIISRSGEGTKIVLCGDIWQIDSPFLSASSNGLAYVVDRLKSQAIHGHVTLGISERSELAAIAARLL